MHNWPQDGIKVATTAPGGRKNRIRKQLYVQHTEKAVVTGAGTGIGRAVSLALLKEGYQVALLGRRADPLNETKDMAGENSASALVLPTDVADPKSVSETFKQVVAEFGRLDLLFNNAGISAISVPFEELTFEQWKPVVDINLNGVFAALSKPLRS